MRLTCPNCGAEYDAPASMIPAEGRHAQCSACHTRWFVRGDTRPALTEEQIFARLEQRNPRLHLRAVSDAEDLTHATPEDEDPGFDWEGAEDGGGAQPTTEPDFDRPAAARPPQAPQRIDRPAPAQGESPPRPDPPPPAAAPAALWSEPVVAGVPQPQKMPEGSMEPESGSLWRNAPVPAPAASGETAPPPPPEKPPLSEKPARSEPAVPSTRLDLTRAAEPGDTGSAPPPAALSRRWALVAVALAVAAAAVYLLSGPLATG